MSTPDDAESEPKRRKVRAGTRSCWECKRRKMKCTFDSPSDDICIRCHRRGVKCVSQDLPEEVSAPLDQSRRMGDRVVRVESLVKQLIQKVGNNEDGGAPSSGVSTPGFPTPVSIDVTLSQSSEVCTSEVGIKARCIIHTTYFIRSMLGTWILRQTILGAFHRSCIVQFPRRRISRASAKLTLHY
jgi:hypothetical protein